MMNRAYLGVVAVITTAAIAPHQQPAPRTLGAPTAVFDQEFTGIDGLRELRDGRVIVLDARERAIHVIDGRLKSAKKIGRDGDGPGEFRLPRFFLPLGGDTTLVSDMARYGKLLVITPAGAMGGFVSTRDNSFGDREFVVAAVDMMGRFYERNIEGDSTSIVCWDRARHRRDTLAHYDGRLVSPLYKSQSTAGGVSRGGAQRAGGPTPPFSTASQWAISADGHLAVVTPEPYQVTMISPTGVRSRSQRIPVMNVPVGKAEKEAYRIEHQRPMPTITLSNGVQTSSYTKPHYREPEAWPAQMPAFLMDAVTFASDGMLWVRRATRAGAPPLYDVFDQTAKLAYQLELPRSTKLAGFGTGTVYLARVDDTDMQYLQRYTLPRVARN